ncbi:MAG: ribosome recycling factor, partial [Dehalococcoidia bacterium]|nr:ribosome recycling factor [Dehalococcoidia bacterium]
ELKDLEKEGLLSEDEARVSADRVQKLTDETVAEVDRMLAAKEQEIMQV